MMTRWTWFTICSLLGLLSLLCGWLMPVHLRAIEPSVLRLAGRNTPSLTAHGSELLHAGQLGPAELLSRAAQNAKLPSADELASAVETAAKQYPLINAWGTADSAPNTYFSAAPAPAESADFADFVVREQNRNKALSVLQTSQQPAVRELLQSRALTNTTVFPPSQAPGGEAFDTAVVITGLLMDQGKLTPGLSSDLYSAASEANRTGNSDRLEQSLLDFLSLGQRFNWGQLVSFVSKTESAATLNEQTDLIRNASDVPILFAATELSGDPKALVHYVKTYPATGMKDIAGSLQYGSGGMKELLQSDRRLFTSHWRQLAAEYDPFATVLSSMSDYCWRMAQFALIIKWLLYLAAGFLLALAMHFGRPPVTTLELPLQVRGFHVAREFLFALGFLLVVLIVSEPFLAQESMAKATPFRLRIPTVGSAIQPGTTDLKTSFMDKAKILPMLLFFVLQALLYVTCVVKLAEIRRQRVGPRVKVKLLENEEHLFDAGLYLGFLGTIVSFIVYSLSAAPTFPLMVAYSSTSFGILFVSFFKIFHLRPVRRRLLLEAEVESDAASAPAAAHALSAS